MYACILFVRKLQSMHVAGMHPDFKCIQNVFVTHDCLYYIYTISLQFNWHNLCASLYNLFILNKLNIDYLSLLHVCVLN